MTLRRPGFTLVELLVVVLLLGLIASVAVVGLGAGSKGARRREAASALLAQLTMARLDAMQRGKAVTLSIEIQDEHFALRTNQADRRIPRAGLIVSSQSPRSAIVEARFEPTGRTSARLWRLEQDSSAISEAAGTIWLIEFDPVSGSPRLVQSRPGDRAIPTVTEVR